MEMELAYQRIWIPWLRDSTGGKKPSLDGQRYAKWSDRSILLLYADAKSLADSTPGLSGEGFVIPPDYATIDLDDCFNEDGNLKPAARTIVNTLGSYTEHSPSKKGVHVIVKADLQGFSKLATTVNGQSTEVLTPGNFVTFTGLSLGRTMPELIANCTSVLEQRYADAGVIRR